MQTTFEEQRILVTIVDAGSITAAAARLGQTTSTVSRGLARLERKIGTTLLRRTTRRLELTAEGETFLHHCRVILAAVAAAEQAVAEGRQEPVGRLRVNAAPTFMQHVLAPLIGVFRERYPRLSLELDTHDRVIDLLDRGTDVAIRIGALTDSSLHASPLGQSRLQLLASPAYLERHGMPADVAGLMHHSLLGFNDMTHLNHWPVAAADGHDLAIKPTLAASSASTLRALALAGQGIACLADYTSHADRAAGALVPVLREMTHDRFQAINAVYYRNAPLTLRVRVLLDFLSEHMRPML